MSEQRIPAELKRFVADRACNCCEYCKSQEQYATQTFSADHIIPRSKGGKTEADNLAFACMGCNAHKYSKTEEYDPVSRKTVPLFHPRKQNWNSHFRWNNDFSLIIGLTPTGRATVETLNLNREGIVNLRRVLYAMGDHPPA